MPTTFALEARGLVKHYGETTALGGVDLAVPSGTVTAVLGPNGAGKTTAVRILATLTEPDEGQATVAGYDVRTQGNEVRRRIGLAAQDATVDPLLTGRENLVMLGELHQLPRKQAAARATELLAEFSLTHLRRTSALALSGGERRRVEIARALASRPSFVLLDEPLAGIDPINVNEIRALVGQLKDRGIGVLITDHNVRDTLDIIDRAYILHEGRVLMEGRPEEIVAHEGVRRVYLGERFSL